MLVSAEALRAERKLQSCLQNIKSSQKINAPELPLPYKEDEIELRDRENIPADGMMQEQNRTAGEKSHKRNIEECILGPATVSSNSKYRDQLKVLEELNSLKRSYNRCPDDQSEQMRIWPNTTLVAPRRNREAEQRIISPKTWSSARTLSKRISALFFNCFDKTSRSSYEEADESEIGIYAMTSEPVTNDVSRNQIVASGRNLLRNMNRNESTRKENSQFRVNGDEKMLFYEAGIIEQADEDSGQALYCIDTYYFQSRPGSRSDDIFNKIMLAQERIEQIKQTNFASLLLHTRFFEQDNDLSTCMLGLRELNWDLLTHCIKQHRKQRVRCLNQIRKLFQVGRSSFTDQSISFTSLIEEFNNDQHEKSKILKWDGL